MVAIVVFIVLVIAAFMVDSMIMRWSGVAAGMVMMLWFMVFVVVLLIGGSVPWGQKILSENVATMTVQAYSMSRVDDDSYTVVQDPTRAGTVELKETVSRNWWFSPLTTRTVDAIEYQ